MERVDIYDQDGNRTGKVIARGEALQEGEYLLTVGIWIVDSAGTLGGDRH